MPTLQMTSVRVEEYQLLELGARAKRQPTRQGFLQKCDGKGRHGQKRWCCLYRNFLFAYETETCTKPSCLLLLEGCLCKPGEDAETSFSVAYEEDSASKGCVFFAKSAEDRDEWVTCISNANMSQLQHKLSNLQRHCQQLEQKISSSTVEVNSLKDAHQDLMKDNAQLRASVGTGLNRRSMILRSCSSDDKDSGEDLDVDRHARTLQRYIRSWLIRRRWRRIITLYKQSPQCTVIKRRNQLIWKLLSSEEEYVSQLSTLVFDYQRQFEIAACSRRNLISMEQSTDIFRNCEVLLLFHQLLLRGLCGRIDRWPVVNLGDILQLFIPMLPVYHQYVGNHIHAMDVLTELKTQPQFKAFMEVVKKRPACLKKHLEELLLLPLGRILNYIQEMQELKAHTPTDHVDYQSLCIAIQELEAVQKVMTDEVSVSESMRQVLQVEHRIEGGCRHLLDSEQALVRKGYLFQAKEDKLSTIHKSRKSKYCFLFTKHLLVTRRLQKKGEELYRLEKDMGVLPLAKLHIREHSNPEMKYLGLVLEYADQKQTHSILLVAHGVSEKAEWVADIAQCIENEKQNRIIQSQSMGAPAELNSKFMKYSTFRSGKEQLVSSGNLDSLLERLTKAGYFGLDFLNTFFLTFPLFTTARVVLDYLVKAYYDYMDIRLKEAICHTCPTSPRKGSPTLSLSASNRASLSPRLSCSPLMPKRSASSVSESSRQQSSVKGIFFAIKHWICKYFSHFSDNKELSEGLRQLLDDASHNTLLNGPEKRVILEVTKLYSMQSTAGEEATPLVISLMECKETMPPRFELVLQWDPAEVAEQMCIIDSTLFCRISGEELLQYNQTKVPDRERVTPNLTRIFKHFNRMTFYWMWAVARQENDLDRIKVVEFLIRLGNECLEQNNFSGLMQVILALEHSSVQRFKGVLEGISKQAKTLFPTLRKIGSTEGRFKELRAAVRRAESPLVPHIGIALNELVSVSEAQPTYLDHDMINFCKMRRYSRIIRNVLQHQKDPYNFTLNPAITKALLSTQVPGNEDKVHEYLDKVLKMGPLSQEHNRTSPSPP